MEIEIAAAVEDVWQAVSTAEGFTSWFAPEAGVKPGAGGEVFVKWGEGMEGTQRIEIWEPNRHLRIVGDRPEPAPPSVVDYLLEGRGGTTVLRMVHSGFGETADFNSEYDATGTAWPLFLKIMKHSVERGIGTCRNATVFRMLQESPAAAWERLTPHMTGAARHFDPVGHCCSHELPDGTLVNIFCETCGGTAMLTIMNLLYGAPASKADAARERWTAILNELFGSPDDAKHSAGA
jgi:uncharacterized protein YndB with AHSA1/START domain